MLIGTTPRYAAAPFWMTVGALFVDPVVALPYQVPASGPMSIPLQLPLSLPLDQVIVLQCGVLQGAYAEAWMSNSASVLVRS